MSTNQNKLYKIMYIIQQKEILKIIHYYTSNLASTHYYFLYYNI